MRKYIVRVVQSSVVDDQKIAFVFMERPAEDAKALNTDVVCVDKDLFKAGVATLYLLCTSSPFLG